MNIRIVTATAFAFAALTAGGVRAATNTGSTIPNPQAANDPKEQRPDVEGAYKTPDPKMFATAEAPVDTVVTDEVATVEPATPAPADDGFTTRCGLRVLSTSENAVGDPCATTADVIASLNLNRRQIAYIERHGQGQTEFLAH
jgi:hypothetical protein